MKILISCIIFVVLLACAPEQKQSDRGYKSNKKEIQKLKEQIKKQETLILESPSSVSNKQIKELREELLKLISELDIKIETRIKSMESEISIFQQKLNSIENSYVDISKFETLVLKFNKSLDERISILEKQQTQEPNNNLLEVKIEELQRKQKNMEERFEKDMEVAHKNWQVELKKKLEDQKDINSFVTDEIVRLNTNIEALKHRSDKHDDLIAKQLGMITNIKESMGSEGEPSMISDITKKLFEPCSEGLKENKFCYTMGSMIYKLGGQFVDPTKFMQTKTDLLTYLILSGVTSTASTNKMSTYLNSSYQTQFKKCFPGQEAMIAPQEYWPRLVILSLIFENIAKDINKKKEIGLVSTAIKPISAYVAWYRNACYQKELNKITGGKNETSDHSYGAALDAKFSDQTNDESYHYYKDFIEKRMLQDDIFSIIHPLETSGLDITVGVGHGKGSHHKGKLHLGILSEQKGKNGSIRRWSY